MTISWETTFLQLPDSKDYYHDIFVDIAEQKAIAAFLKSHQGVLITEWIAQESWNAETNWYVLYYYRLHWVCVHSHLNSKRPAIDDLSTIFPVSNRLQRAIYDLTKIPTKHAKDKRPWLSHGYFKTGLLNPHAKSNHHANTSYHFHKVSGDGVHEVPVGPVHAGIIEPGHFRFSTVGEQVLKLEARLGYTHKGIHYLLIGKTLQEAAKIIGRVSGDTTVAYSYAFALACENQLGVQMDEETAMMRAVFLECERLINHVGDLGAIINDTGFTSLAMQFSILKEMLVRENASLTGHRYMMNAIVPNQMIVRWNNETVNHFLTQLNAMVSELSTLQAICYQHHGLQDRLKTTGIVSFDTALFLGLIGVAAKASGVALDSRLNNPCFSHSAIDFAPIVETTGDVAARVNVRFNEAVQSIGIIKDLLTKQSCNTKTQHAKSPALFGIGCVEGWRGPVCVAVNITASHHIVWCHFHDPSWQNWLALEHAIIDNIIADFPLINKSFNLSYSGQDC